MILALGQIDCRVGDIDGNGGRIVEAIQAAAAVGADVIAFPELGLTGYPPEDLLFRHGFVDKAVRTLRDIAAVAGAMDVIVGVPWQENGQLYNGAAWIHEGVVVACYKKHVLPNYGVFDERRYFASGHEPLVRRVGNVAVGVSICEDLWVPEPAAAAARAGAELLININASPYEPGKDQVRLEVARTRAAEHGLAIAYVNMVGGQDELVFDGASFVIDARGQLAAAGQAFERDRIMAPFADGRFEKGLEIAVWPQGEASVYAALKRGLADYVRKNNFDRLILGLSGGVDSALTLALCCDAVGADKVTAVMMPSPYTAAMSVEDAQTQAQTLGVTLAVIPIDGVYGAFEAVLNEHWRGAGQAVAAENLQARIRGTLLMSIANAHQGLVVVTSNKSELAVGYATLYGDLAGGYAPLKDVLKTEVYGLARYRNGVAPVIPERVLQRPPSAELRPNQQDVDSLPPYEVLDAFVRGFVERNEDAETLIAAGLDRAAVERCVTLVRRAEHKRRQAPPGTRVSSRAFGRDWRYPISAIYRDKT